MGAQKKCGVVDRTNVTHWRKQHDNSTLRTIANKQPLGITATREYLLAGNKAVVDVIKNYIKKCGPLVETSPNTYTVALKQCVDSRAVSADLYFLLSFPVIHERTAGSIVNGGHVFATLAQDGVGFVEGHEKCGAVAAAYEYHKKGINGTPDRDIFRIINAIPELITKTADEDERVVVNSCFQAYKARLIAKLAKRNTMIIPTMLRWSSNSYTSNNKFVKDDVEMGVNGMVQYFNIERELAEAASNSFLFASAEGRTFEKQYAHTVFMYDPYRLGRINDPRAIFGLLPNEAFCVTFDFRFDFRKDRGKEPLSRTGMGSVKYAAFIDGGHVLGVGGNNGTRHIALLDTSEIVLEQGKAFLLANALIAEMTENGKTISQIKYNKETGAVEFLS